MLRKSTSFGEWAIWGAWKGFSWITDLGSQPFLSFAHFLLLSFSCRCGSAAVFYIPWKSARPSTPSASHSHSCCVGGAVESDSSFQGAMLQSNMSPGGLFGRLHKWKTVHVRKLPLAAAAGHSLYAAPQLYPAPKRTACSLMDLYYYCPVHQQTPSYAAKRLHL